MDLVTAAVLNHHGYERDGGCTNLEPAIGNELARIVGVSQDTVCRFFKKHFDCHANYRQACKDAKLLHWKLRFINKDFGARDLMPLIEDVAAAAAN